MKFYWLILSILLFLSCTQSSQPETLPDFFAGYSNVETFEYDESPDGSFSFTRDKVFGDIEQFYVKHNDNFRVDDSGRVYIESQRSIHVYNNNGDYKGSIGREGRGPGEFLTIHSIAVNNRLLYVYDANQSRISVFDTDSFELNNEINVQSINNMRGMGDFAVLDNDYLIVGVRDNKRIDGSSITQRYTHYYLIDHSGYFEETAVAIIDISDYYEISNQRGISYPPVPFDRTTLFSLSATGKIYLLWTGQIAIKVLDSKGNYLNGIYYPYPNVPVKDDSDFPIYYESIGLSIPDTRQILGDRLPNSHPAVSHFFVDDKERIWVSAIIEDVDKYEWWVLQKNGELVNKFEWSRDEPIEAVRNGKMYTRQMDEESGSHQIVRYRIEFEEGAKMSEKQTND